MAKKPTTDITKFKLSPVNQARKIEAANELRACRVILSYLSQNTQFFQGGMAQRSAENLVGNRTTAFAGVVEPFLRMRTPEGQLDVEAASGGLFDKINEAVKGALSVRVVGLTPDPTGRGPQVAQQVVANFPLATAESQQEVLIELGDGVIIEARSPEEALRIYLLFIAGLLRALAKFGTSANAVGVGLDDMRIRLAAMKLEQVEFLDAREGELTQEIEASRRTLDLNRKHLSAFEKDRVSAINKLADVTVHAEGVTTALHSIQASFEEAQAAFQSEAKKVEERLTNFEKATREALRLRQVSGSWNRKGLAAGLAFWLSALVVVALLVGLPWLIFDHRNDILAFVRDIDIVATTAAGGAASDAGHALVSQAISSLSRLVLIGIPLAFAVWAIRFLIRFNMRSLLMMDDAGQRRAILDTYFLLVEQGVAVPSTDRAVLLEALFRRPPGHGTDGPEPPHLSELMKLNADPAARDATK